ncbi:MAG: adenylyl-sulfate kinase [Candidatus Jordarchaeum sp.]|uniref:adenylyl-sulfate kinase n=1 Tax=Candidatus Jordarchaeum sp. TaxID=2823881 RepID=UPI00404AF054
MAWTVWICGRPGAGKSTIARALLSLLEKKGIRAQVLGTDILRKVMTPEPTYSEKEREVVYATLVFIAKILNQNGVNVILDATANRRTYREKGKEEIENLILAYVECPLEVCINREAERKETYGAPRDIYKRGLTGKSDTVPGINVPYEVPENPDILLDSVRFTTQENAEKILSVILEKYY